MKKLIFLDIDGTLLVEGETDVHKEVIDAVEELKANNHDVYICTGRNEFSAGSIIKQLNLDNLVTSNGQKVVRNGETVFTHYIKKKIVDEILNNILIHTDKYAYEDEHGLKTPIGEEGEKLADLIKGHGFAHVTSTDKIDFNKIFQMWAFGNKCQIDKVEESLSHICDLYRWSDQTLEIVSKDCGKGYGINKVKNCYQGEIKTYAFGDGINDFSMMEVVDVSVAMGNANDKLKEKCDLVIDTCENNGLVKGFKDLGLN